MNTQKIQEVLDKINIKMYDGYGTPRTFLNVIKDISEVWDCLKDDYKLEILEALGLHIEINKQAKINIPIVKQEFIKNNDTGIEYLKYQPTCVSGCDLSIYNNNHFGEKCYKCVRGMEDNFTIFK